MPNIAANTYRLPIAKKLVIGRNIVNMSTDNPNVPGNEEAVAQLAAAQDALKAAQLDYIYLKQQTDQRLTVRNNAVKEWNAAINHLAALTESLTEGNAGKILSTGYDVRSPKSAQQKVEQVMAVNVRFNGRPGYSSLTWTPVRHAVAYRVQRSTDYGDEQSWVECGVTVEAKFQGNGAIPGQICWYRVAAINGLGQGPWSAVAERPVM